MTEPTTTCDLAFGHYLRKIAQMVSYTTAIAPNLLSEPTALPLFVESSVVLMMAWHESFLGSMLAQGTRQKEPDTRDYFSKHGKDSERPIAHECSLRDLISMAKRRVTFKLRGARSRRSSSTFSGSALGPMPMS